MYQGEGQNHSKVILFYIKQLLNKIHAYFTPLRHFYTLLICGPIRTASVGTTRFIFCLVLSPQRSRPDVIFAILETT